LRAHGRFVAQRGQCLGNANQTTVGQNQAGSAPEIIETQQQTNNIEILPVTLAHVLAVENLPAHHKDPFDRLLVAQAMVEGAVLVSGDPNIAKYGVQVAW
jgi:PIN domain nuclease of toxin-antitoxin system